MAIFDKYGKSSRNKDQKPKSQFLEIQRYYKEFHPFEAPGYDENLISWTWQTPGVTYLRTSSLSLRIVIRQGVAHGVCP
jgi:hypothetical protein